MAAPIKQSIGPAKARLAGYLEEVKRITEAPPAQGGRNEAERAQLRNLLHRISKAVDLLDKKNSEWSDLIRAAAREDRAEVTEDYTRWSENNGFTATLDQARECMDMIELELTPTPSTPAPPTPTGGGAAIAFPNGVPSASLPKMKLPTFGGDPLDWPTFEQMWEATVESQGVPTVQKISLLLNEALKGEAKREVAGFPVRAENYSVVWGLLKERFGKPKLYVQALHRELIGLPAANDSISSIRALSKNIERICRQLSAAGEDENSPYVTASIKAKLPRELMMKLLERERAGGNRDEWSTTQWRDNIRELLEMREECERAYAPAKLPDPTSEEHGQGKKRHDGRVEKSRAFPAVEKKGGAKEEKEAEGKSGRTLPCYLCSNRDHLAKKCTKYSSPEERRKRLLELKRCLKCGREGHKGEDDDCRGKEWKCRVCEKADHVAWTCPVKRVAKERPGRDKGGEAESHPKKSTAMPTVLAACKEVREAEGETLLMAKKLVVSSESTGEEKTTFTLFDTGSQKSWITMGLAKELKLQRLSKAQLIRVSGWDKSCSEFESPKFRIRIKIEKGGFEEIIVNGAPTITEAIRDTACSRPGGESGVEEQLQQILAAEEDEPQLLIGMPDFWEFVSTVEKVGEGLYRVGTTVGSMLCGRSNVEHMGKDPATMMAVVENHEEDSTPDAKAVENFWQLEAIGITDNPEDKPDELARKHFRENHSFENKRHWVAWPWKEQLPKLATNRKLAESILDSQWRRMSKVPDMLNTFHKAVSELEESDRVEEAPEEPEGMEYYMPGFLVMGKKPRLVWHCSSKGRGASSLNECMYRGPIDMPDLAGLLCRFRTGKIVILCDVEKAFHQLMLKRPERDATRFLWLRDPQKPPSPTNIRVMRFKRVPFGVVASPFLLQASNEAHLARYDDEVAREMGMNMYVDNVLLIAKDVSEAMAKVRKSKEIFRDCSMNLREYHSNNEEVNSQIPVEDRLEEAHPKVLGVRWHRAEDEVEIEFQAEAKGKRGGLGPVTRRKVCRVMGSTFDPLGLGAPAMLPLKLFFQSLWTDSHHWDSPLKEEEVERWRQIVTALSHQSIRFPRVIVEGEDGWQLHAFTDASEAAYAVAVYLRAEKADKSGYTSWLMFAKSRLRPSTVLTMPRLELLGVLIGVRALKFVKNELRKPIQKCCLWSDSQCALRWIPKCDEQTKFVQNQLKKIREAGREIDISFRYVNTEENPADVASRGCTPEELKGELEWQGKDLRKLWPNGPEWLSKGEDEWPKVLEVQPPVEEENTEMDAGKGIVTMATAVESAPTALTIDFSRFSTFIRLLHVMIFILRFMGRLPRKVICAASDHEKAEKTLIRLHQREEPIAPEILQRGGWRLAADGQGILRLLTRLEKSDLGEGIVKPVAVNHTSRLTQLLMKAVHVELKHAGVEATATEFLCRYWCPQVKAVAKKAIKQCMQCWKSRAKPYRYPLSPQLPPERVQESAPFAHIGVDFLGPTTTILEDGSRSKCWGLLITCMSTRAVYVDSCLDLSTRTFLGSFRRFIARRGRPRKILSDQGATFKLAANTIETSWQQFLREPEMAEFMASHHIEWKFLPAFSPWMGGLYERLVALVKGAYQRTLGKVVLARDELQTFLAETEASLNHRPLTWLSSGGEVVPLRPIDFLLPKGVVASPEPTAEDDDVYEEFSKASRSREAMLQWWKSSLLHLERFWQMWRREYLLLLRERSKWSVRQGHAKAGRIPKVGDVVLVESDYAPRNLWEIGRIVKVPDGLPIRSATVVNAKGRKIERPIKLLYPMEVPAEKAEEQGEKKSEEPSPKLPNQAKAGRRADEQGAPVKVPLPRRSRRLMAKGMMAKNGVVICIALLALMFRPTTAEWNWAGSSSSDFGFPEEKHANTVVAEASRNNTDTSEQNTTESFSAIGFLKSAVLNSFNPHTENAEQEEGYNKATAPPPWQCDDCSTNCTRQGLRVKLGKEVEKAEICCPSSTGSICEVSMEREVSVKLPPSTLVVGFQCQVDYYLNGGRKQEGPAVQCDPANYCDVIECWACLERVRCQPQVSGAIAVAAVAVKVAIVWCICACCPCWWATCICKALKCCCGCWCRCKKQASKRSRDESAEELLSEEDEEVLLERKWFKKARQSPFGFRAGTVVMILAILGTGGGVEGCSEVHTVKTHSVECLDKECTESFGVTLTMLPAGKTLCVRLESEDGARTALLKIDQELSMICNKESLGFSRSVQTRVAKKHLCAGEGPCWGDFCARVKSDTELDLKEFEEANRWPGKTRCRAGAGFLAAGCITPSFGCLPWRIYAVPTSDRVYEIFDCSSFSYRMKLTLTVESQHGQESTTMILFPGVEESWRNVSLTMTSISQPPLPSLSSTFVTDGNMTAKLRRWKEDFMCDDAESAKEIHNCRLADRELCECQPQDTELACECRDQNLDEELSDPRQLLPIKTGPYVLEGEGGDVVAKVRGGATIRLDVSSKEAHLKVVKSNETCHLTQRALYGCYACETGAQYEYACSSETDTVTAIVKCNDTTFGVTCGPEGVDGAVVVPFKEEFVEESCEVRCGKTTTRTTIKGELIYLSPRSTVLNHFSAEQKGFFGGEVLGIIDKVRENAQNVAYWAGVGLAAAALIALLPPLISLLQALCTCCKGYRMVTTLAVVLTGIGARATGAESSASTPNGAPILFHQLCIQSGVYSFPIPSQSPIPTLKQASQMSYNNSSGRHGGYGYTNGRASYGYDHNNGNVSRRSQGYNNSARRGDYRTSVEGGDYNDRTGLVRRVTEAVVKAMRDEIPPPQIDSARGREQRRQLVKARREETPLRRASTRGGEQRRPVREAEREKIRPTRGASSQGGRGLGFPPQRVPIRERVSYPGRSRDSARPAENGGRVRKHRGAADQARSKQRAHAWRMQGRGHTVSPDRAVTDRAGKLRSQIGEVIGRIEVAASSIRRECLKIPAERKGADNGKARAPTDSDRCRCWWFPCEHGRIN